MAKLREGQARIQLARFRVFERLREQIETLGRARFDHREHEQPVQQAKRLLFADVLAQRRRVIIAMIERGGLCSPSHQLRDLHDVARFIVRETRHRGDQIGMIGIAAN